MANIPLYNSTQMMQASLNKIVHGVLQERIDQVWLNILVRYFPPPPQNDFQVEREAYVGDTANTKKRANVSVANLRPNNLNVVDMHKVLVVEAKRFPKSQRPDWADRYNWQKVTDQLQGYMVSMRDTWGNVQTMYGLAAAGDKVRFYQMDMQNNPNNNLTPLIAGDPILDIKNDAQRIHNVLSALAAWVDAGNNTQ